ncbi:hypothetical protein D3C85_1850030 [compost metagenome]
MRNLLFENGGGDVGDFAVDVFAGGDVVGGVQFVELADELVELVRGQVVILLGYGRALQLDASADGGCVGG